MDDHGLSCLKPPGDLRFQPVRLAHLYVASPGDALLDVKRHVVIFKSWKSDRKHFTYYSFGSTPVKMRTASISSGTIDSHPASEYIAVRYDKIVDPTPPTTPAPRSAR